MLSTKSKGLFIDCNPHNILVAVTDRLYRPTLIEQLKVFPRATYETELPELISSIHRPKGIRHIQAFCAVYPDTRFFQLHTLESVAKAKAQNYFVDLITETMNKDLDEHIIAILDATSGADFEISKAKSSQKELLFAGVERSNISHIQQELVSFGIYPAKLEIGSLGGAGAFNLLSRDKLGKMASLYLELGKDESYLFIFGPEKLELVRSIPCGVESMLPALKIELGLQDDSAARKLLYSNTFDFTDMGPTLLRSLLKELHASIGFYEVQTGQSLGLAMVSSIPDNLAWVGTTLAKNLGVRPFRPDYTPWLELHGIKVGDEARRIPLDVRWHNLFALMCDLKPGKQAVAKEDANG